MRPCHGPRRAHHIPKLRGSWIINCFSTISAPSQAVERYLEMLTKRLEIRVRDQPGHHPFVHSSAPSICTLWLYSPLIIPKQPYPNTDKNTNTIKQLLPHDFGPRVSRDAWGLYGADWRSAHRCRDICSCPLSVEPDHCIIPQKDPQVLQYTVSRNVPGQRETALQLRRVVPPFGCAFQLT